uniref:Dynein light intermediate chain n=1 Tax=Haemonchus contortus TaxID=6289 RepID=A0A7I4XRL3_HAECO
MVASELITGFPLPSTGSSAALASSQHQEDEKLWTRILSEVSSKSSSTLQGGTLIILGDNQSGKSSLLARLEKNESQGQPALEYHFLNVQNDFRDGSYAYQLGTAGALGPAENFSLPVWMLDGEECFAPLIQFALPLPSPAKTVVLLTASIDNPGTNSLKSDDGAKYPHPTSPYKSTTKPLSLRPKTQQERFWQEYVEPVESSMTSSMAPGALDDAGLLPLEQGVLTENCGVSFVVVITKSDLCNEMTDQQADRILVQVRRLCLQLGAALIYTSAKNVKNIQVLYKYVVHRAFGFPFTSTAQLIERDSVFVPAGWDGEKKIEIVKEGLPDADGILEPTREKPILLREQVIEAEDEQAFLQRLAAAESAAPAAQKKSSILDDATDNKTPLSSFFSNLLKDKPNVVKTSVPPVDSAVQLDRILKSATGQQNQGANDSSA